MRRQNFSDTGKEDKELVSVYLGIGSNTGNRKENIIKGFNLLSDIFINLETSSLYETEPMYMTEQPRFLNTVFKGKCLLAPEEILLNIHKIESFLGRNREKAGYKGPRPLDIDILLYGSSIINTDNLRIPHPGIKERMFVLMPLSELESDLKDPETGEKYSDIINTLDKEGIYYFESCSYIDNQD